MGIESQNAITNVYQVKVSHDPGKKRGIFAKGVAPSIIFTYTAPDGKSKNVKFVKDDFTTKKECIRSVKQAKTYLMAMNPYSTEDNPNITPKEVFKIKEAVTMNTFGSSYVYYRNGRGGTISNDSLKRNDYFQLLDLYSNPESDGGKDITPAEQAKIVDTFAKWYY